MAQLTLGNIHTFVQTFMRDKATADIAVAANFALYEFYRRIAPKGRDTITTTAPYDTGTLTLTKGSAGFTIAGGTISAGMVGQTIKIEGSDVWFTLASTSTLSSEWDGEDTTTATFVVYYDQIALPATVGWINEIGRVREKPLEKVDDQRLAEMDYDLDPGLPVAYCEAEAGSSGELQIRLVPPPDAVYALNISFNKQLVELSGTSDTVGLPPSYNDAIEAAVLAVCWAQEDNVEKSTYWDRKAYGKYLDARKHTAGRKPGFRLNSVDELPAGGFVVQPDTVT